jgi:conjugal transfer pilus assembly protein TraF
MAGLKMSALLRIALIAAIWSVWAIAFVANAETVENEEETSTGGFYEKRADGWHWYVDPPPPEEEEELAPPAMVPASASSPTATQPEPMSAAWLREMLPVLRDAAIDSPTDENVSAYFYAQRIMFDKAQIFSDKAQQVVNSDPLLDEDLRLPFAAAAKVATLASASNKKRELVETLADKVGLWVFYDDTCIYCGAQIEPINLLVKRHGLTVSVIHKQGGSLPDLLPSIDVKPDKGQFDNLDVRFTPTVMMVVPPDGFYKISQGFASYSELVDKLVAAGNEYGMISRDEFYAASPMSKGILDVSHVEDDEQVDWNNPREWVPFIRGEMAKTYGIGAPQDDGE